MNRLIALMAGLLLFAAAYAVINAELLIQSVLYRLAANDMDSAVAAFASIMWQSLLLLALIVMLPRRLFIFLMVLVGLSALVNLIYSGLLGELVDPSKIAWMIGEARQSANALAQFTADIALAVIKLAFAVMLLTGARYFLRYSFRPDDGNLPISGGSGGALAWPGQVVAVAALALFFTLPLTIANAVSSERNVFVYAMELLTADPPPPRAKVDAPYEKESQIEKIIWLVDESISYAIFRDTIWPQIAAYEAINFGAVSSLGNCSSPSNLALRSGVNISQVSENTDLRRMPSIWAYARKAGYKTALLDGQVAGPPQNLVHKSEQALIDDYRSLASGLRTDKMLAVRLNKQLRSPGKQFTYVVLRGVHFQYTDHYPGGKSDKAGSDKNVSVPEQYRRAVRYSKAGFFEALLKDVDRSRTAIVYTADHGQHITGKAPPHCNAAPSAKEFEVPLVAFLPDAMSRDYGDNGLGERNANNSASQIFPTTLRWMGYSSDYAARHYDSLLPAPSKRRIWFGRHVIPVTRDAKIEVFDIPRNVERGPVD